MINALRVGSPNGKHAVHELGRRGNPKKTHETISLGWGLLAKFNRGAEGTLRPPGRSTTRSGWPWSSVSKERLDSFS